MVRFAAPPRRAAGLVHSTSRPVARALAERGGEEAAGAPEHLTRGVASG